MLYRRFMGANHPHHHHPIKSNNESISTQNHSKNLLKRVLFITAGIFLVECVSGFWLGSLSLLADSAHMATDFGALLLAWVSLWLVDRPKRPDLSFGYKRAEVIGAFVNGLTIWFLTAILVLQAFKRFHQPAAISGPHVIAVSLLGLAANLYSFWVLSRGTQHSFAMRGAYLHLLGDILGSVAALASGILIAFWGLYWADSVMTWLMAAILLLSSGRLVWDAGRVLMESVPHSLDVQKVREALLAIPGVQGIHDLHIWSMDSKEAALSVHVVGSLADQILHSAQDILKKQFQIHHTTIQVENEEYTGACHGCDEGDKESFHSGRP